MLPTVQQTGAPCGAHEDLIPFCSWANLWHLQETLQVIWVS